MRVLFVGDLCKPAEGAAVFGERAFALGLAEGVAAQEGVRLEAADVPLERGLPRGALFCKGGVRYENNVRVRSACRVRVPGLRAVTGFFSAGHLICSWWRRAGGRDAVILVHTPSARFLYAAALGKLFHPGMTLVLLAPGAPGCYRTLGRSLPMRALCAVGRAFLGLPMRAFAGFALGSDAACARMNKPERPMIVLDAVRPSLPTQCTPLDGHIAVRYEPGTGEGLRELLAVFSNVSAEHARLTLVSDVPPRGARHADARVQMRVPGLSVPAALIAVPRASLCARARCGAAQMLADAMATGMPVATFADPELPRDCMPYVLLLRGDTSSAMADTLSQAVLMPPRALADIGARGREFVQTHKSPAPQAARLRALIEKLCARSAR